MKKTILITVAAVLLLGVASCNKDQDGVYNPKKKISKIYLSYESEYCWDGETDTYSAPRHLSEQWDWDGNLLVSRTSYGSGGSIVDTYTYTYDGKRLSRVDWNDLSQNVTGYTTFSYDGKELMSADVYSGYGTPSYDCTYRFTHTDSKITRIEYSGGNKKAGFHNNNIIMDILFPMDIQTKNRAAYLQARKASKDLDVYIYEITWSGNNISQIKMSKGSWSATFAYTYDGKKNPFYGMWRYLEFDPEDLDKNNVQTRTYSNTDMYRSNSTYTYTYSDDYPMTCTVKSSENDLQTMNWENSTDRYEYEYLK